jgi:hypothetical protein
MDSITHLTNKLTAERARQPTAPQQQDLHQQDPQPETAPPPYNHLEAIPDSDVDSDADDDNDSPPTPTPVKLTINATHSIHGSNNIVPTSPTPLADAAKFSTLLMHAVNSLNAAAAGRGVKVNLTINCGITVVGDKNVVGNVGIRPKMPAQVAKVVNGVATVAGAKRKAEEVS